MGKVLGHVRLTVPGSPSLQNRPAVVKVGGKNLEDYFAEIIGNIDAKIAEIIGNTAAKITVDNIAELTDEQLDTLKAGDVVIKKTGTERHAYTVAYKDDTKHEIALVYCDAWNVEEVYYDKSVGGEWSLIETKTTVIDAPENADKGGDAPENPDEGGDATTQKKG